MKDRVGEEYINNQGCKYKIIKYLGRHSITIQFEDGYISDSVRIGNIKTGGIKNPYFPSVVGVGYLGEGVYNPKDFPLMYDSWTNILYRCYSKKFHKKCPSYEKCVIANQWKCFQYFGEWFEQNHNEDIMKGWAVDKDILQKGNKIYSPETCAFVPPQINSLFCKSTMSRGIFPIGVRKENSKFLAFVMKNKLQVRLGLFNTPEEAFQAYKLGKESYVKEVADEWKDLIDPRVYEAMYNYKVEITD